MNERIAAPTFLAGARRPLVGRSFVGGHIGRALPMDVSATGAVIAHVPGSEAMVDRATWRRWYG